MTFEMNDGMPRLGLSGGLEYSSPILLSQVIPLAARVFRAVRSGNRVGMYTDSVRHVESVLREEDWRS